MKKHFIAAVIVVLCASPITVFAQAETQNVLIVELQTGQPTAAGTDFVEFYNPNLEDIDVTGWRLQYRSAGAEPLASWTTKRSFACPEASSPDCRVILPARGRLVAATYDIPDSEEQSFSGGFAAAGGQVRLVLPATQADSENFQQDLLGYGTAVVSEGQPSVAPTPGKSLKRKLSEDGYFVDTQNNALDFTVGCGPPTPGDVQEPLINETPECDPSEDPTDPDLEPIQDPPIPTPTVPVYLPLEITELLPDPIAPFKDDTDEFVEIFNPNSVEVNIENYALHTGASLQNKTTLSSKIVPAGGFMVITSGETSLNLTNSGTAVQLVDPVGQVLEEVPNYGSAKSGHSWMKNEHGWHWSSSPTPGAVNVLTVPSPPPVKPASVKRPAATPKKVAAAKTTTPKASAPKPEAKPPEQPVAKAQPNYWIIAAIGGVAVAYGVYEYRQELRRWGGTAWQWLRKK